MRRSFLLFVLISLLLTLTLPARAADQPSAAPGPTIVPVIMQLAIPPPQDAKQSGIPHEPMPEELLYGVLSVGYALVGFAVLFIFLKLRSDQQWSLGRALSENTVMEQQDDEAQCKKKLVYIDLPSSSRLIAFLGMIVLLSIFLALGTVMVWTLGRTGKITSMGDAQGFLWAGLSMFAPYLISQSKDALKAFGCDPAVTPPTTGKAHQPDGTRSTPAPNASPAPKPSPGPSPVMVPAPYTPPAHSGGSGQSQNG
ncbi:hypothetical protein [Fundidesulfovibrio putealis]|uniref:hypothetical protein n=1 Tax=Fundidesulfovibrio putealis TaxID=270496 RepID=UPI0003FB1C02|nr:hypothetical protein [Fundidesulfovibrio putealis]